MGKSIQLRYGNALLVVLSAAMMLARHISGATYTLTAAVDTGEAYKSVTQIAAPGDVIKFTATDHAAVGAWHPADCFSSTDDTGGAHTVGPTLLSGLTHTVTLTTKLGANSGYINSTMFDNGTAPVVTANSASTNPVTIPGDTTYVGWLSCQLVSSQKSVLYSVYVKPKCNSDAIKETCAKTGTNCIAIGCTKAILECATTSSTTTTTTAKA